MTTTPKIGDWVKLDTWGDYYPVVKIGTQAGKPRVWLGANDGTINQYSYPAGTDFIVRDDDGK